MLINADKSKIKNEIFNVGYQNLSISSLSQIVKKVVENEFPEKDEIKIETTSSDDNRSYHINSDKIKNALGFQPKYTIEDAVKELCDSFKKGLIKNSFEDDIFYNIKKNAKNPSEMRKKIALVTGGAGLLVVI